MNIRLLEMMKCADKKFIHSCILSSASRSAGKNEVTCCCTAALNCMAMRRHIEVVNLCCCKKLYSCSCFSVDASIKRVSISIVSLSLHHGNVPVFKNQISISKKAICFEAFFSTGGIWFAVLSTVLKAVSFVVKALGI